MLFSNATNYALRAILYLALNSSENNKIGIQEIAKELNLPYHFLGKLLQTLARNQLVQSSKGPNGGFFLTETERNGKIIRIIEIFEEPDIFNQCALGLRQCADDNPCPMHQTFKTFRKQLLNNMETQSIKDWSLEISKGNSVLNC